MITPPAIARIAGLDSGALKKQPPAVSPKPALCRLGSKPDSSDEDEFSTIRRAGSKPRRQDGDGQQQPGTGGHESNTLPFANENVGTIKQRNNANAAKQSIVTVDIHESFEETATIKRRPAAPLPEHGKGENHSVDFRLFVNRSL